MEGIRVMILVRQAVATGAPQEVPAAVETVVLAASTQAVEEPEMMAAAMTGGLLHLEEAEVPMVMATTEATEALAVEVEEPAPMVLDMGEPVVLAEEAAAMEDPMVPGK